MKPVSYRTCEVLGVTAGEHSGHDPSHSPCTLYGVIESNCSTFVFIDGEPVATVDSITREWDCCCAEDKGVIAEGSSLVFIEGKPVARIGDRVQPHNGTAEVITGCDYIVDGG